MEKKSIKNITTAVVTEEQLIIKTNNTGTVKQAQVSAQAEVTTAVAVGNVIKTRH